MSRSWVYNAWGFGSGVAGGVIGAVLAAVLFTGSTDLVAAMLWSQVLGAGGALAGFAIGGYIGVEHEDRVARRLLGLPTRTNSGKGGRAA